ncbi:MAG: class I SAM-dependent methyltransferase, partial [Bdellovibrionales bacterium]|nr:class I SAM-dependent methyltransferase [Bdellovibrionales bacterium]
LEILDLGCANGSIAKCLAQIDIKGNLYGVDFSEEMVGAAKKTNLYRSVICADLTNGFPIIEENVFDVVFMLSFLEFIEDPKILLADVYRSLKPGGKVFLTFEAMQNKETLRLRAQSTPEVSYYSTDKESILNLLDGAGLVVESWDEMVGYVSPSTSMPINYFAIVAVRKS